MSDEFLSVLSYRQKCHLAWRLDHKTACGLLTACAIARGQHGDMKIVDIFKKYGGKTDHSAKIHTRKVLNYE